MWEPRKLSGCRRGAKAPPAFRRHRIMSTSAPRMAAAQPAHAQPRPAEHSMGLERLEKISGTGRLKTAARAGPAEERQHRRNQQLVTANKKTRQKEHQGARIEARSAR